MREGVAGARQHASAAAVFFCYTPPGMDKSLQQTPTFIQRLYSIRLYVPGRSFPICPSAFYYKLKNILDRCRCLDSGVS